MDSDRHVTGCHLPQETRVQHAFDDVAENHPLVPHCQSVPNCAAAPSVAWSPSRFPLHFALHVATQREIEGKS
jgi:hypothetical protein